MATDTFDIILTTVCKSYEDGHRALSGLSLTVPRGSIMGFVGLNGAGKSTTIRLLAGLEQADEGQVTVLGQPAMSRLPETARRIGFVLDDPFYFDWLSAREYCIWSGQMYGLAHDESQRRTGELLDLLDLPMDEDKLIGTYSTGMKKKTSLAAALVHAPSLLILDEPLEAVDAVAARTIKSILTDFAARGSTVFITSHALDTVERFCSDVCIIHEGRIIVQSPMAQLADAVRPLLGSDPGQTLEENFVSLVAPAATRKHLSYV
jgi:ABC-2 type transport system ATP-binding protein